MNKYEQAQKCFTVIVLLYFYYTLHNMCTSLTLKYVTRTLCEQKFLNYVNYLYN